MKNLPITDPVAKHSFYVYRFERPTPPLISSYDDRERAIRYCTKLADATKERYFVVSLISNKVIFDSEKVIRDDEP